jgi:hypothetical protein
MFPTNMVRTGIDAHGKKRLQLVRLGSRSELSL